MVMWSEDTVAEFEPGLGATTTGLTLAAILLMRRYPVMSLKPTFH